MNIFDYTDEQIQFAYVVHMKELLSVIAGPLMTVPKTEILPTPHGASESQEFLWTVIQLHKHPDADEFSRRQLGVFLTALEDSEPVSP